jgi:hypothetical protein
MDGLEAATKSGMTTVAATYQHALTEMQSATPPPLADIKAEIAKTMTDLTHDPNASIAGWAKQQTDALDKIVADQKAADAKILEEQTAKWVEADQKERDGWNKILADQQAAAGQLTGTRSGRPRKVCSRPWRPARGSIWPASTRP